MSFREAKERRYSLCTSSINYFILEKCLGFNKYFSDFNKKYTLISAECRRSQNWEMKREKFLENGKNNSVLGKKKAEKQPAGQVLMHKTDSMLVNYIRSMEDFDSRSC